MPGSGHLIIRIKKAADGRTALSCTRPDGTTTWQRLQGGRAAFFPRHDLTHYAVETVLRFHSGFFGLVAQGWDLSDFGTPWPRGPLPPEGNLVEMIVSFFDRERATGLIENAEQLRAQLASYSGEETTIPIPSITDDDLLRVRERRAELFERWNAVVPGGTLEVIFDVGMPAVRL